jgi:hypothetical protein
MATPYEREHCREALMKTLYEAVEGNRLLGLTGAQLREDLAMPEEDLAAACTYLAASHMTAVSPYEAESAYDEATAQLVNALAERRCVLRVGRQDRDPGTRSEKLRLALRQYREITRRLLRIWAATTARCGGARREPSVSDHGGHAASGVMGRPGRSAASLCAG